MVDVRVAHLTDGASASQRMAAGPSVSARIIYMEGITFEAAEITPVSRQFGKSTSGLLVIRELRADQRIMHVSGSDRLTLKYHQIGFARGIGQNLEQACEISLTLPAWIASLHEVNVRIRNSVSEPRSSHQLTSCLGDHRIRFERS